MSNSLLIPIYAHKPKRRIPGTNCVAVTMHRSYDGSVAEYAIFTEDGEAYLGNAHFHPKRKIDPRGYSLNAVRRLGEEHWSNLTEFALEMGRRHGLDVAR